MNRSVVWPAFIKFSGDDELVYVADHSEWLTDADLSYGTYESSDRLIDSDGQVFSLSDSDGKGKIEPVLIDEGITSVQFVELIQKHFAVSGACCVSKIKLESLSDCMSMLQHDREN